MDLDLGYLSKGLTKRSVLGQCGGSLNSSESGVEDFAMNMVNDFSTTKVNTYSPLIYNQQELPCGSEDPTWTFEENTPDAAMHCIQKSYFPQL